MVGVERAGGEQHAAGAGGGLTIQAAVPTTTVTADSSPRVASAFGVEMIVG